MINFVDAGRNKNVTIVGQLVQDLGSNLSFCTVTILLMILTDMYVYISTY